MITNPTTNCSNREARTRTIFVLGISSLVLSLAAILSSILSLCGAGILTGIPAWVMGKRDLKKITAGRMLAEAEGRTEVGMILGIVSCVLNVGLLTLTCFFMWHHGQG